MHFFRGLNFNIVVNLVFLLLTAMMLINAVVLHTMQRIMLKDTVADGDLLAATIIESMGENGIESMIENGRFERAMDQLLQACDFSRILIMGDNLEIFYSGGIAALPDQRLITLNRQTIRTGEKLKILTGSTWGLFWKQESHMILSYPVRQAEGVAASISLVYDLQNLYRPLRDSLYIIFMYMMVNAIILTIVGFYRLSRITVKPIKKLVESVESYQEDDDILVFGDKEGDEFSQLSKSLNQMIFRISESKNELRSTVRSLEKANEDLNKAQSEIINAEKMASVGRLSAGIAHEIGNPIAIIIGYLELLRRDDLGEEERREYIFRAESELNRINTIIRQLLDFSRPSVGEEKIVSIHELILEMIRVINVQPMMSRIELETRLSAEIDTVQADAALIRQIFLNLIMNAADAMKADSTGRGGKLIIETESIVIQEKFATNPHPGIQIRFRDNGPGIAQKDIDKIFEPFFTTKAPGKGTGLGLAVCFMIAEACRGHIGVSSIEGQGTTMLLDLPLSPNMDE